MAIRKFDPPRALRGYDTERVDAFLKDVATRHEQVVNEVGSLRRQLQELEARANAAAVSDAPHLDRDLAAAVEALEQELETLRQREAVVGAALLVAQQTATEIRAKAQNEIQATLAEANGAAEHIRVEAQKDADRLISEARQQAQKTEDEASAQRSAYEEKLEQLRLLHESTRQNLADILLESLHGLQELAGEEALIDSAG